MQGNFVTLTNLSEREIDRIIKYRISPINVSVHTTDPELRKKMLNNKNAGRLMDYLERLKEGEIEVKAQIVLCPGLNDGEHLVSTLRDLAGLYPQVSCTAVVPVGITKYRQGLYELTEYDAASAASVINLVKKHQDKFLSELNTRFVFLSDEFYLISGKDLPMYEEYEEFMQLENGVGLIALFNREVEESLKRLGGYCKKPRLISMITGVYAAPILKKAVSKIESRIEKLKINKFFYKQRLFGTGVKVSGLLTGKDIIEQLIGQGCWEQCIHT